LIRNDTNSANTAGYGWQELSTALAERDEGKPAAFNSLTPKIGYSYGTGPALKMQALLEKRLTGVHKALVVGSENPWVEYELFKAGVDQVVRYG
jgi:hypothetical protein